MSNSILDAIDEAQRTADREIRFALLDSIKRQAKTEAKLSDAIGSIGRLEDNLDLHKALIDAQHDNAESLAKAIRDHGQKIDRWIDASEADRRNQFDHLLAMLASANDRIDSLSNQLAEATKRIDFLADLSRRDEKAVGFAPQGDAADAPPSGMKEVLNPTSEYVAIQENGKYYSAEHLLTKPAIKDAVARLCAMKSDDLKNLIGYQDKPADAPTFEPGKVRGLLVTMSGLLHEVMRARNTNTLFHLAMEHAMGETVAREWYASACKAVANASARVTEMTPDRKD